MRDPCDHAFAFQIKAWSALDYWSIWANFSFDRGELRSEAVNWRCLSLMLKI